MALEEKVMLLNVSEETNRCNKMAIELARREREGLHLSPEEWKRIQQQTYTDNAKALAQKKYK